MKKLLLFAFIGLCLLSCKENSRPEKTSENKTKDSLEIQDRIAQANGLKNFDDIQEIDFTFNVKVNDSVKSSRAWHWEPHSKKISLTQGDITQSYMKKDSLTEKDKEIDRKFINDSYWLLFPFQLVWSDASFSSKKNVEAPISHKKMDKLIVSYNDKGGYTPGDTYEIYYGDDLMIKEWVYKAAGGGREMATTWEDYEDFKGIKIAKSHKSADGSFEIFFSDIEIK